MRLIKNLQLARMVIEDDQRESENMNKQHVLCATFSILFCTAASPSFSENFFRKIFEPSHISEQKAACEAALREELEYKTGYQGIDVQSGFIAPEVFNLTYTSSNESEELEYRYAVYAEGVWKLALEDDPFDNSRHRNSKRIIDSYRVVDLGILSESGAEPRDDLFMELIDRQHIAFKGAGVCQFLSELSKTPSLSYISAETKPRTSEVKLHSIPAPQPTVAQWPTRSTGAR